MKPTYTEPFEEFARLKRGIPSLRVWCRKGAKTGHVMALIQG